MGKSRMSLDVTFRVLDAIEQVSGLSTTDIILAIQTRNKPGAEIGWHDLIVIGYLHELGWSPEHTLLAIEDIFEAIIFDGPEYPPDPFLGFIHFFYETFDENAETAILLYCDFGAALLDLFADKAIHQGFLDYEQAVTQYLKKEGLKIEF